MFSYNVGYHTQQAEEKEMTPYSQEDLAEDWEFKILRSLTGRFRTPVRLRAILEEEARAGWMLVEKFDSSRLRLKRPVTAKVQDAALPFDARRSWYGLQPTHAVILIFLAALVLTATILALTAFFHIGGVRGVIS